MSEYVYRPGSCMDVESLGSARTCPDPVDWYGTLHEEIVRCRDCKHSDTLETAPSIVVRCCYMNKPGIPRVVGDDGFCAWGERREP